MQQSILNQAEVFNWPSNVCNILAIDIENCGFLSLGSPASTSFKRLIEVIVNIVRLTVWKEKERNEKLVKASKHKVPIN